MKCFGSFLHSLGFGSTRVAGRLEPGSPVTAELCAYDIIGPGWFKSLLSAEAQFAVFEPWNSSPCYEPDFSDPLSEATLEVSVTKPLSYTKLDSSDDQSSPVANFSLYSDGLVTFYLRFLAGTCTVLPHSCPCHNDCLPTCSPDSGQSAEEPRLASSCMDSHSFAVILAGSIEISGTSATAA